MVIEAGFMDPLDFANRYLWPSLDGVLPTDPEWREARRNPMAKKAIVWSSADCPWCGDAKRMLESRGIEYEERIVGGEWSKDDLLKEAPGAKTVPQVFLDGEHVGGFAELQARLESEDA